MQEPPRHENVYLGDGFLRRLLQRKIPKEVLHSIEPELARFGGRVSNEIWLLGRQCEENPPRLKQTDGWGHRVDDIITSEAWKTQKRIAAEEGLIAIAYERKQSEFSRLYQALKLCMFSPSSGLYSCPLAMTDGAAKTIEANQLEDLKAAYDRLTSRNPDQFWTSGQWMTEKGGGSDVASGTETFAVPIDDKPGYYGLHGYKWFSSATDSDVSLALARIVDNDSGSVTSGGKGVSMFYLETRNPATNRLNNIQVAKLKDKLGTRQLPTAELLLDGTVAKLVSPVGRGIPSISNMLHVTRLHNILSSVAGMRKILLLARDYATRRTAFGDKICDKSLHAITLQRLEVETRGCQALAVDLALKLGLDDNGMINDQDALLLRLLTPIGKMYTGKKAVAIASEGLECFGGQGYIEETGLPGMLRDAQVLPIWEGTTNILSLDVLRVLAKSKAEALIAFKSAVLQNLKSASANGDLAKSCEQVEAALKETLTFVTENTKLLEVSGRDLSWSLAHIYIASLLLEQAADTKHKSDILVARSWVIGRDLKPVVTNFEKGVYEYATIGDLQQVVYDGYDRNNIEN